MSSPRRRGSSLKLCMDSRFHGNDTKAALLNPKPLLLRVLTTSTTTGTIIDMATLQPILPANEARANFYQILEEAGVNLRQFTITHRGKPLVVMMSQEEFEGWQETLEIMGDKKLLASLTRSMKSKKVYTKEQADTFIGW